MHPYDGQPPSVAGSDTSAEAARSVAGKTARLRDRILAHVDQAGGATCWEIEQALGLSHQTASARVRELVLLGRLQDSGLRRATNTGRNAAVWMLR